MSYLALRSFAVTCLRSVRSGWKYSRARSLQWMKLYRETKAQMRDAWTRYTNALQSLRLAAMHAGDAPKPLLTLKQPRHKATLEKAADALPRLTLRKHLRSAA